MIPIGEALQSTGLADLMAQQLASVGASTPPWFMVAALLLATMFLSDLVNNAAAAVIMAPVAVSLAGERGTTPDAFLMAVAVGASCAFLTPIGHQSNILVMGPGGYRFGDYWRLGLPLEVLIAALGVPLIVATWG